ncbi:MAG: DNA methyltransferase [Acidimicrobiales bacterium]
MSHGSWQLLPELTTEEYQTLKADIAAQGVLVPLVIDADTGEVIEGHHRLRAWTELRDEGVKVPSYPREVRSFATDEERIEFVLAANLFRRHLNRAQRAEVVARLRQEGWSLRRIGVVIGADDKTVRNDLAEIAEKSAIDLPERVERKGGGTYPARRPRPVIFVQSDRDAKRAAEALQVLGDDASGLIGLSRAEERARAASMDRIRAQAAEGPSEHSGEAWILRTGDFREALGDLADQSVDAIVTDPPYDNEGVPLYEPLGAFCLRVLKPGRLAAIYAGHLRLDEEMDLLARGGLTYMWHGVNVLPGLHTKVHVRKVNGRHRSVLLYSAGPYQPRQWVHDLVFAEGRGGPDERPLHPWQQAVEPVRHWIRQVSEPDELIVDPFLGSGTTAVAAVLEGRRFLGCDIDPGCVETTRRRLEQIEEEQLVVATLAGGVAE